MSCLYANYDATADFCKQWTRVKREAKANADKPRILSGVKDQEYLIRDLFQGFLNHTLAAKYPNKMIQAMYGKEASDILNRLCERREKQREEDSRNSEWPNVENILSMLNVEEQRGYVYCTLSENVININNKT